MVALLTFSALAVIFLQYGFRPFYKIVGPKDQAGIWVQSNKQVKVSLDGKMMGMTPFRDTQLRDGQYQLELNDASSSASWQGQVRLNSGTVTVVNRQLSTDPLSAAGEVITLQKGAGLTIVSAPPAATVFIDGVERGQTPLFLPAIPSGGHQFVIGKDRYVKRAIRALATDGYSLNIAVDLAESDDITPQAGPSPSAPSPVSPASAQLVVTQTPNGFLRVRAAPSIESEEKARLSEGAVLVLEEETNAYWYRVKTSEGVDGYVSSAYVRRR